MRRVVLVVCVLGLFAALAPPTSAQTVAVNPTLVQFSASDDHSKLNLDGTPIVARYEMRVYVPTALFTVVATQDLGKPAPATDGTITVPLAGTLIAALVKNTQYVAEVVAVGPYGEGASAPSNPFGFAGPPKAPGTPAVKK